MEPQANTAAVAPLLDHLFRKEAGRLVALLTRLLGPGQLALAEDLVQETLVRAYQVWPQQGVPANPSAWLYTVARNLVRDHLRHRQRIKAHAPNLEAPLTYPDEALLASSFTDQVIQDSQLKLMFACCDEKLTPEAQVALILNTLGGLGPVEIARAFLLPLETIKKRLVRAKHTFRTQGFSLELPTGSKLLHRLAAVQHSIYLTFNEGYNSTAAEQAIQEDICQQAMHWCWLLTQQRGLPAQDSWALLALMSFQVARFPARLSLTDEPVLLAHQDRSLWNQALIAQGRASLLQAQQDVPGRYHLEAAIAACHCQAPSYQATNWAQLLSLYDALLVIAPSPVAQLNRSVVLAQTGKPALAYQQLQELAPQLNRFHLYHAVLADVLQQLGRTAESQLALNKAIELANSPQERALLQQRQAQLGLH